MRDTVSSRATFFMKFVFPALWILGCGAASIAALASERASPRGASSMFTGAWDIVVIWLVCSAILLWFCAPLKRIRLRHGRLLASNFRTEIEILPGDIERVTQNKWVNLRPITLHLRRDGALGRHLTFIPPSHVIVAFGQSDRLVSSLREFAGLASHPAAEPDTARRSAT